MEHRRFIIAVAALLLGGIPRGFARGQEYADAYAGDPMASDAAPAAASGSVMGHPAWGNVFPTANRADLIDAHGEQIVMPAGHYAGWADGSAAPPAACGDCGDCGCDPSMYGYGTCPPFDDGMATAGAMAGYGQHQCGPHYFDIRAEAVYLKREQTWDSPVNRDVNNPQGVFTSLNADPDDPADFVLAADQLNYDYEPGFRLVGRYDVGPLSVFEFSYMGIFNWHERASFTDPDPVSPTQGNLFSLFSDFGTNPANVIDADGPMGQSERAVRHTISLDSELQVAEMSFRRYWVGYSPHLSGTLMTGPRYTRLAEEFIFFTEGTDPDGGPGTLTYLTETRNDLGGWQFGADAWLHLLPGVRIGTETKGGVYNNHWRVYTDVSTDPATVGPPTLQEAFSGNNIAFIGEGSLDLVIDILPSLSLRAGLEALYITPVALSGPNFNPASPYQIDGQPERIPFFIDGSDVLYHGGHAGLEYIW